MTENEKMDQIIQDLQLKNKKLTDMMNRGYSDHLHEQAEQYKNRALQGLTRSQNTSLNTTEIDEK